jgi:hypothetical protein
LACKFLQNKKERAGWAGEPDLFEKKMKKKVANDLQNANLHKPKS